MILAEERDTRVGTGFGQVRLDSSGLNFNFEHVVKCEKDTCYMFAPAECTSSEVSQIGNVEVGVNVDVASHPVGCSPPQILVFPFHSESNSILAFSILLEKGANKKKANITKTIKRNSCFGLENFTV